VRRHAIPAILGCAVMTLSFSGCGTMSGMLRAEMPGVPMQQASVEPPVPVEAPPPPSAVDTGVEPGPSEAAVDAQAGPGSVSLSAADGWRLMADDESASALAQAPKPDASDLDAAEEEYDPWEPFNERMFTFNRNLDRYVLKPVARAYNYVMPEPFQIMISNGFENLNFVPRVVNNALQGKWSGAGIELSRFVINSTAGIGGLWDPAKDYWGIQKHKEDFGQTLGVWGSGPGPYLILPFMEPLTVRDGIGKGVDGFMDPLSYVLPFWPVRLGMKIGDTVNDRALNYDLFQGFEESVIDMYSAVRHGYLQRREKLIRE
jgi:phospholipid-binding lipoprotein MlaA